MVDDSAIVHQLFAREVPEVASGAVEIRAVARARGRTKVAVATRDQHLDAIGSCVGQRGHHVKAIAAELGERLDLITWAQSPEEFIRRALSPARIVRVLCEVSTRRATAYVEPDQVSIAHGKDGVNRDLASELTGWKVEIVATDAA